MIVNYLIKIQIKMDIVQLPSMFFLRFYDHSLLQILLQTLPPEVIIRDY